MLKSEEKLLGIGKVNISFIRNSGIVKRATFHNVGAKMTYEIEQKLFSQPQWRKLRTYERYKTDRKRKQLSFRNGGRKK